MKKRRGRRRRRSKSARIFSIQFFIQSFVQREENLFSLTGEFFLLSISLSFFESYKIIAIIEECVCESIFDSSRIIIIIISKGYKMAKYLMEIP